MGPEAARNAKKPAARFVHFSETLSHCDLCEKADFDGHQDTKSFFIIYVDEMLTDCRTFNIVFVSGLAGTLRPVIKKASQRGFGYGECE